MVDNVTRWRLQKINPTTDSFMIFDTLYGNSNIYNLSDLTENPKLKLEDAFVSGSSVYILMSNDKGLELNLLTKEVKPLKNNEYQQRARSK